MPGSCPSPGESYRSPRPGVPWKSTSRDGFRSSALFAVAQQAAAVEPLIAGFWQQGRAQSRQAQAVFWTRMADDGLLDPQVDLAWLIDTASLLAAAETYLLITRMTNWDLDTYQNWLAATLTRLSRPITGNAPADHRES
jgi:hypothetical protein